MKEKKEKDMRKKERKKKYASGKAEKFCCEWMRKKKEWKKKKSTGTLNPGVQCEWVSAAIGRHC